MSVATIFFGDEKGGKIDRFWVGVRDKFFSSDDKEAGGSAPSPSPSPSTPKRNLDPFWDGTLKTDPTQIEKGSLLDRRMRNFNKSQSAVLSGYIREDANIKKTKKKTKAGEFLSDFLGAVKDGVLGGVKNGAELVVDKATGMLIKTPGVQGATDSISDLGNEVIEKSITKFFKKNWFYIILPIAGLFVFFKFINTKNKRR